MSCLNAHELEMLAGNGSQAQADPTLQAHLDTCPRCRENLSRWRRDLSMAGQLNAAFPELLGQVAIATAELPSARSDSIAVQWRKMDPPALPEITGYEILREIHRGGQGAVFEAIQLSTRRTVAVKLLLEGPFASDRARWRFEREVKLIAALKHPNIIIIHDSGTAHGHYFFAMDYVRGEPLDTHVRLTQPSLRPLVQMFCQICDAVACAHRRGVIHRDLKPSNIVVTPENTPCVLDFGLAKIISEELEDSQQGLVSIAGGLMGTLRYMAPEQTLGAPDVIDTRTDVYALGVILYELLTGGAPYNTNTDLPAALKNIREVDPPRPSKLRRDLNADVETIVLKAMSKEPDRRYQSAGELGDDLAAWLDGRPISARSASSLYVLRKLATRNYFETLLVASLVLAIFGFGLIALHQNLQMRTALREQAQTVDALIEKNGELDDFYQSAWSAERANSLGWFLLNWREGQMSTAAAVRDRTDPESPARRIMSFLLDDQASPEDLIRSLPTGLHCLGHIGVGEKRLRAGDLQGAAEAFEKARDTATTLQRDARDFAQRRLLEVKATTRNGAQR